MHEPAPWRALNLPPCTLGESPFWHPDEQRLYWVDIAERCVHRFCPATGCAERWSMPSEPGCIAPVRGAGEAGEAGASGASGSLLIALRDGVYLADHWGGPLALVARARHDVATHRFNDGKADPCGRFWVSTINESRSSASAELLSLAAGGLSGGEPLALRVMATGATVGNGLAWSPDARTLYWADTSSHTVRAWDWHAHQNTLCAERIFKQWPPKPTGWQAGGLSVGSADAGPNTAEASNVYAGRPDGAAVDVAGNYYVAMYEGACILKLSPAGHVLASLAVPAQCPTMPCLGGADGRTLYVTTARQNRPAAELARYPDSGCLFTLQVDVPGLPVNFYAA